MGAFQTSPAAAPVHVPAAASQGEPFYFGPADKQLFGCYHTPSGPRRRTGVLICHPFGHEYIRAHRACRQLALRLAHTGLPVLRFDYYGCGDSSGDDGEGQLRQWLSDIEMAMALLKKRGGVTHVALAGLRLGAALALAAGAQCGGVDAIVLWEPVRNGSEYLDELSGQHRETLWKFLSKTKAGNSAGRSPELLGFRVPASLYAELEQLDLLRIQNKPAGAALIVESEARPDPLPEHLARLGTRVQTQIVPAPRVWTEDPDKALVPHATLQAIVAWLSESVE